MSPRPAIFISAVTRELRSARQLVSNTLTFLGYEPEWQDIFSTEEGDLRGMLRRRIDACQGVVQLVGQCYGAEPPAPDEQFGRVSYTQYEALYARQQKKKVWSLILNEDFSTDPHEPESEELRDLQNAYRARLKSENLVRHSLGNRDALEANVLKLRDELSQLRRGAKRWATTMAVLLVLSVGLGVWLLQSTNQKFAVMDDKMEKLLRQGTVQLPAVQSKIRQEQVAQVGPAEIERLTYEALAKRLGVDAKVLEEKLPQFANQLRKDPNASAYERASAAYVARDYDEAERLALVAVDEAEKASKTADVIKTLELAGNSADALIEYARALQHFRAAAQLTDRSRDPMGWAHQQSQIAKILLEQGKYVAAEEIFRDALSEYQRAPGENENVLIVRYALALTLQKQGKYAEAEVQNRELLRLREKLGGPEHPDTLSSRNSLANVFFRQGKYAEAEVQYREVIQLQEKVMGPENLDTLGSRNNLAAALSAQGRYAEAMTQYVEVLKLREKILGPEHPDTLASRVSMAVVLDGQKKYAEAEAQYRKVIKLQAMVLGPEHPDTLSSLNALAVVLAEQGQHAEAEIQFREVLLLREKVVGPEHPQTLESRCNLAGALLDQSKYAEAEAQFRGVLKLLGKVMGPQHPETLQACFNFALCLKEEKKMDEAAEFARRAAEGAAKVLGVNHPDTLDYQKLWEKLQKK